MIQYTKQTFLSITFFLLLFGSGCTQSQIVTSHTLPSLDKNSTKISLYALENYTDTPRAGLRAANIVEGILLVEGYNIANRINNASRVMTLDEKISDARSNSIRYIMTGGVSEWRYKTGIDGEPAISLQLKLIDTQSKQVVWSSIGSDNSWGNASIGTVAQSLIESMID